LRNGEQDLISGAVHPSYATTKSNGESLSTRFVAATSATMNRHKSESGECMDLQRRNHERGLRLGSSYPPNYKTLYKQRLDEQHPVPGLLCNSCHSCGESLTRTFFPSQAKHRFSFAGPAYHCHEQGGRGMQVAMISAAPVAPCRLCAAWPQARRAPAPQSRCSAEASASKARGRDSRRRRAVPWDPASLGTAAEASRRGGSVARRSGRGPEESQRARARRGRAGQPGSHAAPGAGQ